MLPKRLNVVNKRILPKSFSVLNIIPVKLQQDFFVG